MSCSKVQICFKTEVLRRFYGNHKLSSAHVSRGETINKSLSKWQFCCKPLPGQAIQCPPDSDTGPGARSLTECTCNAGYFQQSFGTCAPCPPQLYKPNGGNEDCKLQCPANANSSLASTALDDCFCMADHHAQVDDDGYLYRCASCALYEGLSCEGGFKENRKEGGHREPVAKLGFFRTGNTLAVRCDAETEDGSSTCLGGSLCSVDGTSSTCALNVTPITSNNI